MRIIYPLLKIVELAVVIVTNIDLSKSGRLNIAPPPVVAKTSLLHSYVHVILFLHSFITVNTQFLKSQLQYSSNICIGHYETSVKSTS